MNIVMALDKKVLTQVTLTTKSP